MSSKKKTKAGDLPTEESPPKSASTRQSPRKKTMAKDNFITLLIGAVNAVEGTNPDNPMNPLNQPRFMEQVEVPHEPRPEPAPLPVAAPQKKAAPKKKSPPPKKEKSPQPQKEKSPPPKKEKLAAIAKKEEKPAVTKKPASPTPKKEPQKPKKLSLKSLQSQEKIGLDTLTELPPKMLREMFSEKMPQQNLYSDKFNFICVFHEDGRCKHEFKVFRDERNVHKDIQDHLQAHIRFEASKGTEFHTCSVQYRRKQKVLESKKKKQTTVTPAKKRKPTSKSSSPEPEALVDQVSNNSNDSKKSTAKKRKSPDNKENLCNSPEAQNCVKVERPAKRPRSNHSESSVEELMEELDQMPENDINFDNQPTYDHTYAAPPGGKPKQGRPASPSGSESDESSLSSGVSFEEAGSRASSPGIDGSTQFGLDGLPVAHEETILATSVESVDSKAGIVKKEVGNNTTTVRRRQAPRRKVTPIPQETKDLSHKYIRELQNKKKEDDFKLVCKICNDGKVFTAGATLQNHYKSHAGMKPFSCHKCPQTFTRKHSLKYHLLIHLGKSRFTCEWCARQFRHPSHFKEHKRKHTGETPYECTDCLVKYKTRNTYKRHLRTHHGKVLSSKGVYIMTEEEFAKVRTKKYKKSVKSNCSSPEPETSPVPSTPSTPSPIPEDQKRPRKITRKPRVTATKPTPTTPARSTQPHGMTLPPVSTILPPFATHSQAGTPVNPHSIVHVNSQQVLGTVSQASVGVMPPMGTVRSGTPVGVLGMAMVGHGMVLPTCSSSLTTPTPVTLMRPATFNMAQPAITIPQPTVTMAAGMQGQTYYTITAFSPVMPVDNAQPVYAARPVSAEVGRTPEVDMGDYKPVGYITHN